MGNISDEIVEKAINSLPDVFDTHAVIQTLMMIAPRQYAGDLCATSGEDPIQNLHASNGRRLLDFGVIEPTKKVSSANVRGQENKNQEWSKT